VARLFVPPALIAAAGAQLHLTDEPHRYLSRVLRLRGGDEVTLFDGAGTEIEAQVVASDAGTTLLALGARRTIAPAGPPVVLLQAIPKGERMDLLVQKTTELGISRICPVVTARTVVQPGAGKNRLARWRTIAQEAARQCGRADLPIIDEPRSLASALHELPAGARLMAWEQGTARATPLRKALAGSEPAVTLLVGAEGGFTAEEAEAAVAAGFSLVGLGPRILRSETAAIVAVALVQAALGALDAGPPPGA
jgi:16S rRNA (uracil1498-N3)-methyltransferase